MALLTLALCSWDVPSLLRQHPMVALFMSSPRGQGELLPTLCGDNFRGSEGSVMSYPYWSSTLRHGNHLLTLAVRLTTGTFEVSSGVSFQHYPYYLTKCCAAQRSFFSHFVSSGTHTESSCHWRSYSKSDSVHGCKTWKQAFNTNTLAWLQGNLPYTGTSSFEWASQLFLSVSSASSAHPN